MLEVKDVSKMFDERRGVQHVNFTMERGEIVGFLGPNGAGKTTTMRMITGYLNPTSGSIAIDGLSMSEHGAKARGKIGYLPETPPLYPEMTVMAYLRFVADLRNVPAREQKKRIDEMLDKLGLHGRERQLIRSLSKGYKQRLGLAQAIIHKPDLLVLDEPTSGLDPNQIIEIRQLIRELGEQHTVLLSTHILPEVNMLCNRVLIIHQGRIVLDERPDRLGAAMGQECSVHLEVKGPAESVMQAVSALPLVAEIQLVGSELKSDLQMEEHNEAPAEAAEEQSDTLQVGAGQEMEAAAQRCGEDDGQRCEQPGVPLPEAEETVKLRVVSRDQSDVRESIFYALADAGLPLLEMKREMTSLEDVFTRLTTEEDSGDA
ncbi:ABC transporter ATP-binding protein [Paenibacillus apiarius]|uniref:ABC transporter ATP-binding protein n=1 Tax=Paenibacillus apiarius TaxID=46240 RepID=A0ABT4E290_9BACL|nr:ABC transporter ATP-binding protein [Paenibacillus apiarius]MCY9516472.1 ABC transporter ATP-binding protein [Paenibacillus apiarius]MCY9522463.1 ABC transporter ATP-binding protein [Paenibacillus apiarius]MCY9554613.1 ABC transporter ATP-binding protein [Paenibacillus apiarius]MCY9556729.1 ABC transporter ATP-binding protein [Paenibacillus apiarius]MCY9686590.1 ABC transporter ATP-binding protein [Paenibacillus apiarius]